MYRLYYASGACSMAPHVLLNELGVPFELEKVSFADGQNKSPEYLKLNPRGQVPVLVVDGEAIREGAAIMTWLADTHSSPLLPKSGIERARALQWLSWGNATLHPAYGKAFWISRAGPKDEAAKAELMQQISTQIQSLWNEADARLGESKYLAGDQMTVGDILLCVIANWSVVKPDLGPNVKRLIKDVTARPSYQKALATEQVEYKAAA